LLLAGSAQAAVFIGISTDGGATIDQVFTSPDDTFEFTDTNLGGFDTVSVEGDAPLVGPGLLHSDVVSVGTRAGGNISIFVTRTDLDAPPPRGFFSSFTSNNINPGFNIVETTYADAGNGLWAGTQLATTTFSGLGAQAANITFNGFTATGPYSVTTRYDITASAGGSTSPTILLIGTAVPEASTWALMIMGFGGAGAMLRGRRQRFNAA
jgi:hypothetical protein